MITKNLPTLQIQKLTKKQFETGLENNSLNDESIYLTPVEIKDYALKSDLNTKADLIDNKIPEEQIPDIYLSKVAAGQPGGIATLDEEGKVPSAQLPEIEAGVTSWDDLTDKPFGTENVNLTFSGNISDYLSAESQIVEALGIALKVFRISENYYTSPEETYGAEIGLTVNGTDMSFTVEEGDITEFDNGFMAQRGPENGWYPLYINVTSPGETIIDTTELFQENLTFNFTNSGLYLFYVEGMLVANYFKGIQIKKLDKEYIPSEIGTWSNMSDKPFYEDGININWDLQPTDTFVSVGIGNFYKMTDTILSKEDLVGANFKAEFDGTSIDQILTADDIFDYNEYCYGFKEAPFFLITTQATEVSIGEMSPSFPSAGIWFISDGAVTYAYHLSQGNRTIKQIDPKFIPNAFYEIGSKIEWDGTPTSVYETFDAGGGALGYFYKVAEPVDTIINGTVYIIQTDGEGEDSLGSDVVQVTNGGENGMYIMNVKVPNSVFTHPAGVDITFREVGLYFFYANINGQEVKITSFTSSNYSIKQIDKKFIPDDIVASVSLTFDEVPTEGSQNPVKSMGIHSAISALEGKITSTFCYKGTVDNYSDLPTENNTVGDVWNITNADEANGIEAGDNAAWDGTNWDILAGVIDLSNYYTKTEVDSISLNGVANLANYYTKAESNNLYYTKTQIDDMIGDCDTIINSINTLVGGAN